MKLTLETKSFIDGVAWVTKAFDGKDEKSYVALHVDESGKGFISHANGTSHMRSEVNVLSADFTGDGVTSAKIPLEGRYIQRLAASLKDHSTPLQVAKDLTDPKATLEITRDYERFTVPLLDVRVAEAPKYSELGEVSESEFFDALQRLAKLSDPANAGVLPVLGTVDALLNADASKVVLMATDRYALGEIILDYTPAANAAEVLAATDHVLIPTERASLISPSKGSSESITFIYEPKAKKFGYSFTDGRLALFSLSAAEPLVYSSLKERGSHTTHSALINLGELKNAIGVISNLAYDEAYIELTVSEDSVVVSDSKKSNTLAVNVEETEGNVETLTFKFSRSILQEAFSPIASNRFKFKWTDANGAVILEPIFDDGEPADNVFILAIPSQG